MSINSLCNQRVWSLAKHFMRQNKKRWLRIKLGLIVLLLCRPGIVSAADIPALVQDLTPAPYQPEFILPDNSSTVRLDGKMVAANGLLFFVAQDNVNGIELWKSDGTSMGTALVKDLNPGIADSLPNQLTVSNNLLFFTADDGSGGEELWKTDGTFTGTVTVKDILPGPQGTAISNLIDVNGTLFFLINNKGSGIELWKSNGTAAGTVLVKDGFSALLPDATLSEFTVVNDKLLFAVVEPSSIHELWSSDGTPAGTTLVKDIPVVDFSTLGNFTKVDRLLFFTVSDDNGPQLWKSDGTEAGTVLVQALGGSDSASLTAVDKTLFFVRTDNSSGIVSLWKSDGTPPGTVLVREMGKGELSHLIQIAGVLFFFFDDRTNENPVTSLWKSNGAATDTVLLYQFSKLYAIFTANVNGVFFFSESGSPINNSIWRSDGTSAGTFMVVENWIGDIGNLVNVNTALFFTLQHSNAAGLWKFDNGGTVKLKPFLPTQGSSTLSHFFVNNQKLFFTQEFVQANGVAANSLWASDGTARGTERLHIFSDTSFTQPSPFVTMNHKLFFIADDGNGRQIWQSDGTMAGTTVFKAEWTNTLAVVNSKLFFATGATLWKSDGTAAGTELAGDVTNGESCSCYVWIDQIIDGGGTAFLRVERLLFPGAHTFPRALELWKSDGAPQGTIRLKTFATIYIGEPPPISLDQLTKVNGVLFFIARQEGYNNILWRSDGTPEGTISLTVASNPLDNAPTELTNANGTLFFAMGNNQTGAELWKSDGTVAGTSLVKDILPGSLGSAPTQLTAIGKQLFFSANDGEHGRELWQSDGTAAGTVLVKDLVPGAMGAVPQQLANVNGNLVFSATDGQSGVEAWRSDGIATGTTRLMDIAPGPANANPDQFIFTSDQMFFTANDGVVGQELWSLRSFANAIPVAGGELNAWLDHTLYQFPAGAFTTAVTVTHTLLDPSQLPAAAALRPIGRAFSLTVRNQTTVAPVQPAQPYSLTVQYSEAELGAVMEATLALYDWNGQQWVKEPSSTLDQANHRILATPAQATQWVILGETNRLFLPLIGGASQTK